MLVSGREWKEDEEEWKKDGLEATNSGRSDGRRLNEALMNGMEKVTDVGKDFKEMIKVMGGKEINNR